MANFGLTVVATSCDSVVYDYTDAPADLCEVNTSLEVDEQISFNYQIKDELLSLSWSTTELGEGKVVLINVNGQLAREERIQAGSQELQIQLEGLSSGVYLLKMFLGNQQVHRKIMVQ